MSAAQVSPDGRYIRFDDKLGKGAYKDVYRAYDSETGKEVAWNSIALACIKPSERSRLAMETAILAALTHRNIIKLNAQWSDEHHISFITDIMTGGTLKSYLERAPVVKLKVLKKWCRQILRALQYLHQHQPPIIHRDLKCDNIFVNGSTGQICIGDFGLSAERHATHVVSVLGTPEFMAPELYDEDYTESVDIYAFGMCVLEMATKEYPYEECINAAQIWKRVSRGDAPDAIKRIADRETRAFVELCLAPPTHRLTAAELLEHPFLSFRRSHPIRANTVFTTHNRHAHTNELPHSERKHTIQHAQTDDNHKRHSAVPTNTAASTPPPPPPLTHDVAAEHSTLPTTPTSSSTAILLPSAHSLAPTAPLSSDVSIDGLFCHIDEGFVESHAAHLRLHIPIDKKRKQIKFKFDFRHDTADSIATDMVGTLHISNKFIPTIAAEIEGAIHKRRKHYFESLRDGHAHISVPPIQAAAVQQQQPARPNMLLRPSTLSAHHRLHSQPNISHLNTAQTQQPKTPTQQTHSRPHSQAHSLSLSHHTHNTSFGRITLSAAAAAAYPILPTQHHNAAHQHRPHQATSSTAHPIIASHHHHTLSSSNSFRASSPIPRPQQPQRSASLIESKEAAFITANTMSDDDGVTDRYKAMSVSALKESIKALGGDEQMLRCCFEKTELIATLVQLTPKVRPLTITQEHNANTIDT